MNISKPMTSYKKAAAIFVGLWLIVTAGFSVGTEAETAQIDSKLRAAISFRADMADAIATLRENPNAALARLQKAEEIKGLSAEPDADLAVSALDVGHRLISLGHPSAAEAFFRLADEALTKVLSQQKAAFGDKERVQYLKYRAHLRGDFLNRQALARADIDAAVSLQPDDKSLEETRARLAGGHGEEFKSTPVRN